MIEFSARLNPDTINRFTNKMVQFRKGLEEYSETALKKCAERYYEIIISHIGEYTGGEMVFSDVYWEPLKESWLKEKREHGWVEEIWEATGEIRGAVRMFGIEKNPNGSISIFVGLKDVSPEVMTKACHNEFGATLEDRTIPSRPLFEPAKREMVFNSLNRELIVKAFKTASQYALGAVK